MFKKILVTILISVCIAFAFFLKNDSDKKIESVDQQGSIVTEDAKSEGQEKTVDDKKIENGNEIKSKDRKIDRKVPFVVQAPFGNWNDPVFQDGCEEASIVMAKGWVNGKVDISPQDALDEIKDIIEFENDTFGFNADTDLNDVQKIFSKHFSYEKTFIKNNINVQDVINELEKGNLILIPAFGQALKNPNFTQPGPVAHMLVIKDYDRETGEFITNDPGTKRGENYRYKKDVLFNAIWEYPRGKGPIEVPKKQDIYKGMLVISLP